MNHLNGCHKWPPDPYSKLSFLGWELAKRLSLDCLLLNMPLLWQFCFLYIFLPTAALNKLLQHRPKHILVTVSLHLCVCVCVAYNACVANWSLYSPWCRFIVCAERERLLLLSSLFGNVMNFMYCLSPALPTEINFCLSSSLLFLLPSRSSLHQ